MMKVVGATAGQITSIYLIMVACFGILALLIAVPAGLGLAYYLLAYVVVENLNFDLLHFYLPWQILLLEVGVGLASPLFAALVPILGGTRLTAAQAISDFSSSGRTSFLDAIMARIRGLPSPVMLAIRNTFRKRMRLALTLATLTFAGMLFVSIVNVRNSLLTEVDNILSMSDFDVQVIFNGPYDRLAVEKRAMQVPGVVYAEGWAITSAQRIRPGGTAGGNFTIYGLQPASTFTKPIITDGRWLREADRYAVVITTELLRDETDLRVGDSIKLDLPAGRKDWQIVGVIKSSQPAAYALYDRVADLSGLPNQTSVLNVRTAERSGPFQITLAGMLRDHYDDWDIKVLRTSTSDEIISGLKNNFNILIYILFGMAILVAAVGGLGLAGMMSLNVMERTREIGVIRAVGASDDAVRRIVLVEGMMVGLISWVGALPLAFPVSQVFDEALGNAVLGRILPFTYDLRGVGIWLLFILVIAAGASLLPARRAARISVREALAYE
jgi:putative ABC transport system permease protein